MPLKLGVLASGNGSNFQAIHDSITRGSLNAKIEVLICNRPGAYVIERAKKLDIPFFICENNQTQRREEFDVIIVDILKKFEVDVVVLAGYMLMLSSVMTHAFQGKIVNIHPSILPAFKGIKSIKEAIEWGVKFTGCTVHFVDELMDHGSVIIQAVVPVLPEDNIQSLQERIQKQEYRIYPQALQWISQNRIRFCENMRTISITPLQHVTQNPSLADVCIHPPLEEGF